VHTARVERSARAQDETYSPSNGNEANGDEANENGANGDESNENGGQHAGSGEDGNPSHDYEFLQDDQVLDDQVLDDRAPDNEASDGDGRDDGASLMERSARATPQFDPHPSSSARISFFA
jgi:hypothetical protein